LKKPQRKVIKFLESNENENTSYQNFWYIAKAVLRGKFIGMSKQHLKKIRAGPVAHACNLSYLESEGLRFEASLGK
jgi:hypothetical protein